MAYPDNPDVASSYSFQIYATDELELNNKQTKTLKSNQQIHERNFKLEEP